MAQAANPLDNEPTPQLRLTKEEQRIADAVVAALFPMIERLQQEVAEFRAEQDKNWATQDENWATQDKNWATQDENWAINGAVWNETAGNVEWLIQEWRNREP